MSLSAEQVQQMKRAIESRLDTLRAEVREDMERSRQDTLPDLAGPAPDPGDISVADLIADIDNSELERDVQEIRELEAALERIASGTYGQCMECGRDIGFERLRVQPAARRCIDCQTAHERTFAGPGAPTL